MLKVFSLSLVALLLTGCYTESQLLYRCNELGYIKTTPLIKCELVLKEGEDKLRGLND